MVRWSFSAKTKRMGSNEKAVLEALSLELDSIVSTYPNPDADVDNKYTVLSHNDQINVQHKTDRNAPRNNKW